MASVSPGLFKVGRKLGSPSPAGHSGVRKPAAKPDGRPTAAELPRHINVLEDAETGASAESVLSADAEVFLFPRPYVCQANGGENN